MAGTIVAAAVAASAASAASAPTAAASAAAASASPGLIVATLGFFAGLAMTWPALIGLALLGILFEHNGARGWAVTMMLGLAATSYFFFAVPLMTILVGASIYVAVGLVWSWWRYKRHVDKTVVENREADEMQRRRVIRDLHPKAMLSIITAWILIWPFSMIENIAGDLINMIQSLVTKVFRGIYHKIYSSAVEALTPAEDKA